MRIAHHLVLKMSIVWALTMRLKIKYCLCLTALLCINTLYSDPPVQKSLSELVDIALQNNPQTKTTWWNARRAAAALAVSSSAYGPKIGLTGQAVHGRDYQFLNGNIVSYTNLELGLYLNYLIYDFGERKADCVAAKAALQAAGWQSDWAIQQVIHEVLSAAYAYQGAREILEARTAAFVESENSLNAVETLFDHGVKSISDLYTMRAAVSEAKMRLVSQRAELSIARTNLLVVLGVLEDDLLIEPLEDPIFSPTTQRDTASLLLTAERQRADLQAKYADIAEKAALKDKIKAQYLPRITLNGDIGGQRYVRDNANGFNYNVGLNLAYPFYNSGEAAGRERMAHADWEASIWDAELRKLAVAKEISVYKHQFEAADELIQLVNNYVRNAELSYESTLDRYKAGTDSIFELTSSQNQLAEARVRKAEIKVSWYSALAGLSFAAGILSAGEETCVE